MPIMIIPITKSNKNIIIIASIFILAILSFIITSFFSHKSTHNNIIIYIGNKKIEEINGKKIDINIDGEYIIGDINAEYNIIEIKDKKIRCIDASCPDKICIKHGYLKDNIDNDMIVCAPHKLCILYD